MKIDFKSKQTRYIIILLAVIIIPIIYNQTKTAIAGLYTAHMMAQPKTVQISKPFSKEINPTYTTTGRIEASLSVDIIARVDGFLQKRYFEEGDRVKKGQKLYLIEPDQYALAASNAHSTVAENAAVYKNSEIDLKRAKELLAQDLVSREYYDNALTQRNKNRAALDGSIAEAKKANLNLSYTNITAPMDGRIGKTNYSVGNYVSASSGVMTTIYSTNPMKVIFPLKSGDFIELKRYYKQHANDTSPSLSVLLQLADGSQYENKGKIEFVNNQIDESTGTVTMRAIFENPDELLVPGDYANVSVRVNEARKVMVIPQSATKTDVGTGYYVWVIKDGVAQKRDIVVQETIDNYWIVESGLDWNDDVVMKGIQDIYKSGQKVKTQPYKPDSKESKAK